MLGRDRDAAGRRDRRRRRVPARLGRARGRRASRSTAPPSPRTSASTGPAPTASTPSASRDALVDYLHFAAQLGVHLSRLGAEIVLWAGDEAGFVELDDAFTSGSSMLPQKKNPDAAELARAKAPRLTADLAGLLGVLNGLPLAYNKDLQEDKEYLFDAVDTVDLLLPAMTGMIATAGFRRDRMAAAVTGGILAATDLADHLVKLGLALPPRPRGRRAPGAGVPRARHRARGRRAGRVRGRRAVGRRPAGALGRGVGRGQGGRRRHGPRRRPGPARRGARAGGRVVRAARRAGARPPGRLGQDFFARPVAEVAPDLVGCTLLRRRRRRRDRRDRALPAGRPGLPQLPRPASGARRSCSASRAGSTSTAATGCTGA